MQLALGDLIMDFFYIATYIATGLLAGFFSGLIGIGGGVVVVPALYFLFSKLHFQNAIQMAIATSLAIMIFTTSSSTLTHGLKKKIFWKYLIFLLISSSVLFNFPHFSRSTVSFIFFPAQF